MMKLLSGMALDSLETPTSIQQHQVVRSRLALRRSLRLAERALTVCAERSALEASVAVAVADVSGTSRLECWLKSFSASEEEAVSQVGMAS